MLALVMLYESSPVASAATRVQDCLPQVTASISPAAFTNTNTHIPQEWREGRPKKRTLFCQMNTFEGIKMPHF